MPGQRVGNGRRSSYPDSPDEEARRSILAEVATLYYVDRFNQQQIARQIGRSVSTVSRLLAEAEASGIVEVRVRYPTPVASGLQTALTQRFGLRLARVLHLEPDESHLLLPQLGVLAARYLGTLVTDGTAIGVAGGAALYEVARAVHPTARRGLRVAQALGSVGSRLPAIDTPVVTRALAGRLGAEAHFLPAPLIVESGLVRDALVQDPQLRETLAVARHADIALVGIGTTDPKLSTVHRAGYLDAGTMARLRADGAVADVLVEFVDLYGRVKEIGIRDRVVGLRLADLGAIRTVVAVAGGAVKAAAILGALRTGLIHVLVTDDGTARRVLELADAHPEPGAAPRTNGRAAGVG